MDESFCANCGADILSAQQRLLQSLELQLSQIQVLVDNLELNDAVLALHQLIGRKDHPCLDEIRQRAAEMLSEVAAQRDRHLEQRDIYIGRAKVLLEAHRYREAIHELEKIPPTLRHEIATRLLDQAESICQEIARLKDQLQQREGFAFGERMEMIDRLLDLSPSDPQVRKWASQIHTHVLEAAHKKFQQHRYREALDLLGSLPDGVQSDKSRRLLREVAELEFLESELLLAPTVTPATIEAAKRLLKIDPQHQTAGQALREMTRRLRAVTNGGTTDDLTWTACPPQTPSGLPVHYGHAPRRLTFAAADCETRFHQHPGQFSVACGLALQAVSRAVISTNLSPTAKQGVLGKLRASLLERPPRVGWGLDLSHTSLKAVQLTVDDDDRIRVTECLHIAHRRSLSGINDIATRADVLRETLAAFSSQQAPAASQRIATQWPSSQSLVRLLNIPPVEGRKLRELIQLEARHQIPFPLDDVCWDTFLFPTHDSVATVPQHQVLLLAVRQRAVEEHVALFREHDIEPHIVQSDAVALHNFLHFDRLTEQPATGQPATGHREGIAALDIGSDTTNIVFSFPDFVWFRSTQPAGDDLVTSLTRRFKITHEVATQVLQSPTKVKRLGDLHEELCGVFCKMLGQYEAAHVDFRKNVSQRPFQELLVFGGAGQTQGLLRYLRFGR